MKRFVAVCCLSLPLLVLTLPARAEEPNAAAQKQHTIVNSIGMKLVLIPAGEFQMGGNESAEDLVKFFAANKRPPNYFNDEYPKHRVRITRPFYFGQYEVTVGQFKQFTKDAGYKTEAETDGEGGWGFNREKGKCEGRETHFNWLNPGFPQTDNHPVLDVTWNDAVAFCKWLSKKEGKTYRLPTEAEWEYACRAGTTTRFNCGDDPDALLAAANMDHVKGRTEFPHVQELELPKDKPVTFTVPVGSFKPNRFGLYDMHGNVWEWCADRYGEDYYATSPADDPQGPDDGHLRVRRGGAWHSYPIWVRSSFRNWNVPQSRCVNLGFRVVRNSE